VKLLVLYMFMFEILYAQAFRDVTPQQVEYKGVIRITAEVANIVCRHKQTGKLKIFKYKGNVIPAVSLRLINEGYSKAKREHKEVKSHKDLDLQDNFSLYDKKLRWCYYANLDDIRGLNFLEVEYRFRAPVEYVRGVLVPNEVVQVVVIKEGIEEEFKVPSGYVPIIGVN